MAQTRPVPGDVAANSGKHLALLQLAQSHGANLVVFPELSLTGYEPALAAGLAVPLESEIFAPFQQFADRTGVASAVGAPISQPEPQPPLPAIGLVVSQPDRPRQVYLKRYLPADELPFFTPGGQSPLVLSNVAFAICYELSIPEHANAAQAQGAQIYIASAVKTAGQLESALPRLQDIALSHSFTVLLSNSIGDNDNVVAGGRSSVWDSHGELRAELDDLREGILVYDSLTLETIATYLAP